MNLTTIAKYSSNISMFKKLDNTDNWGSGRYFSIIVIRKL